MGRRSRRAGRRRRRRAHHRELALLVADNVRNLGAQGFARWALGLPWREFCAVVQLCSGHTRRALEAA